MPTFYDTHAHLDYPDFETDLPQVIERAAAAGISKIISIGTDFESSERAIQLAEKFPGVFAVVGWHPNDCENAPDDIRPKLRELAKHPKVVALGETGLDYHRLPSRGRAGSPLLANGAHGVARPADEEIKRKQAEIFRQHFEVAAEVRLNCVIHQRDAFDETLAQLKPFAHKVRGVFHCFVGTPDEMQRVLALNSIVSFTGILTFKNAQTVRASLAAVPRDQFMLETDCPFLAPVPYRSKRCEPAYVKEISETAAQVKGCSLEELSEATCATAEKFFRNLAG